MPNRQQFRLPDVGEGLTEADILTWSVQVGDVVEVNQILVEIETAKAAVELPSPYAGVVAELHAQPGETVEVGRPIITIDTGEQDTEPAPAPPAEIEISEPRTALLVGYGPAEHAGGHRRRRARADYDLAVGVTERAVPAATVARPAAKPPVRKLAKNLGVELAAVTPTGEHGRITREDVHRTATDSPAPAASLVVSITAEVGDRETHIQIRGVRKHTAAAMVTSAFTAPHVTEFMTVDISETIALRDAVSKRREFRDTRFSPLVFVARALMLALRRTPEGNSQWDEAAQEIVLKHYVNLGIAAATPRGLVVPNIKDADQLTLLQLAEAINTLASTARAGKTTPAEMAGGTITITNVGVFGVDSGTPILNPGEAAILAFGAVRRTPWVVGVGPDERIEARWVTQLALSFDHRLIDGQQGSELLADVGAFLTNPGLAML